MVVFIGNKYESDKLIERVNTLQYDHIRGRFFSQKASFEGIKTEIGKTNDESKPSNLIKLYGVQAREIEGHDERLLLALNCDALPMPLARLVPAELSSKCDEDTLICKETNQYFPKNLQQQIENVKIYEDFRRGQQVY